MIEHTAKTVTRNDQALTPRKSLFLPRQFVHILQEVDSAKKMPIITKLAATQTFPLKTMK